MLDTRKMKAVAGVYITLVYLPDGDLMLLASRDLLEEWRKFKDEGKRAHETKIVPENERTYRNLRLKHGRGNKYCDLDVLLADLREGEYVEVLSEHDVAHLGHLTSGPIIAEMDEIERDDDYQITSIGRCWWHANYAVECEIEQLLTKGFWIIPKADD
jgi:hypothetical protein